MPRQPEFKTTARQTAGNWEELHKLAHAAELPGLPAFSELREMDRSVLFQELGYTFWNRELVDALATRMRAEGGMRWVELAAGTGRLTAELARIGVRIAATDDYSQAADAARAYERTICYAPWVGRHSAREALTAFTPEAVLCAWPPLGSCLVPDLLAGRLPGGECLHLLVCIGDPAGATEAPAAAYELPPGWALESWPECSEWLQSLNEPLDLPGSHSQLLIYRRVGPEHSPQRRGDTEKLRTRPD